MTRWLTPAFAFGSIASETTGSTLWKSPTHLSLSQGSGGTNNGYNPANMALDFLSQCTGVSIDKESCLVSTTLATIMSEDNENDDQANDECNPPDISQENLFDIMTDSRAQCAAITGQSISDQEFTNAKNAFNSILTDHTCMLQMCQEFENPSSPAFMEIVIAEATRCAGVELSADDCIRNGIVEFFLAEVSDSQEGQARLLESLRDDSYCESPPSELELYMGAAYIVEGVQSQCPNTLSSTEFDATVAGLVELFGSPQCFGEPPCDDENDDVIIIAQDDTFTGDDSNNGMDIFDIGMKYVEQCAGIELDRDDCIVSAIFDMMSSQDMSRRRFLEEGETSCSAPDISEEMLLALLSGARGQCLYKSIEYTEEEYEQRRAQVLGFFGAESCWIDLCEEFMNPSEAFMMLFVEEVADCAGAQLDLVNQCLVDGVFDLMFSLGDENNTDVVGADMSRRVLRVLSNDETDVSTQCESPSEDELGPFVGLLLVTIEQNCTASGELIGQSELETAYSELLKLFIAPPQCWGGDAVGCEDQSQNDEDDGLDNTDIAITFVEKCSGIDLDMDDCFTAQSLEMLISGQDMSRRRYLEHNDDSYSCNDASPGYSEETLLSVFASARQLCSSYSIEYSTEEYEQRTSKLLDFFDADSCFISLCEETINPTDTYLTILFEVAAECAGIESDMVNQCLWDQVVSIAVSSMMEDENDGPDMLRRKLSHESVDDMCYKPSEAEIAWFVTPVLMEAGHSCAQLGEEFGQAEIDTVYNEFVKLVTAPPKCFGEPTSSPCNGGGVDKKSQDEIDSKYTEHVQGNALGALMSCSNAVETCVMKKSIEILLGNMDSCAVPVIDELGIKEVADKAVSWCTNDRQNNDHLQAIHDMMQLMTKSECWAGVCQNEGFKNWVYSSWMNACSYTDSKFMFSSLDSTITDSGMLLSNDKLKCMADYILAAKASDEESHECSVLQLGPNVCGTDFDLGLQSYMSCTDDIVYTEHPTPSPMFEEFSMSYSFEDPFEWAGEFQVPGELPEDMEFLPYDMSFSYSFDDLIGHSMSYDYEPPSPHEELAQSCVMEVCHLLESLQYNLAARDCMEPICDLGIEGALGAFLYTPKANEPTYGPQIESSSAPSIELPTAPSTSPILPSLFPSASPTASPTAKATIAPTKKPTSSPTVSPTKAKFGSVDVKFEAAVTLNGINVADLDFTALGEVVALLEKVFASAIPEGALVRLLKIGGVSVSRRMLRELQDDEQGVEVEFEVIITKTCDDTECSNSEDISAAAYNEVTGELQRKVEDGSLSTAIQEEADAEGISELANVSVKPDSLKASEPQVTVRKADPDTDDTTDDDDSSSLAFQSTIALAIVSAAVLFGEF